RLTFNYRYEYLKNIPAKVSVSRLYPDLLDPEEGQDYSAEEDSLPSLAAMPQFLGGESGFGAEAGTATHVFMQFCDFDRLKTEGVNSELDRLVSLGFLTGEMKSLVRCDEIARFLSSPLFADMMNAKKLWREQRFNIFLDAVRFTEDPEQKERLRTEKLLVQGVIDCFFISDTDELILVDYKTDRLTRYQISNRAAAEECMRKRHGRQLSYYKTALGEILGRRVDRCLIYSLCLGDVIEI
ncbi:MAG: PD-(D/E)XK nuclease family protein, partial [Clostridia bacterium]|nr:PD-(D/E)XK nuclease family protein [Clostridia bacterium]